MSGLRLNVVNDGQLFAAVAVADLPPDVASDVLNVDSQLDRVGPFHFAGDDQHVVFGETFDGQANARQELFAA